MSDPVSYNSRRITLRFNVVVLAVFTLLQCTSISATPSISIQPVDHTIFVGDPVTFQVSGNGAGSLTYQWYRDGSLLPGGTAASTTIAAVTGKDDGARFFVTLTDSSGTVTSRIATLTVDMGVLSPVESRQLVTMDAVWKYDVSWTDLGTAWKEPGYDDSSWASGPGLLYTLDRGADVSGGPLSTELGLMPRALPPTCYFRTKFINPFANASEVQLYITTVVDDAVVVHLNGRTAFSLGTESAAPDFYTYADRIVSNASSEGPAWFAPTDLVPEENVLAAEVHQANATSSDVVWGMNLEALIYTRVRDTNAPVITEIIPLPGNTVPKLTTVEFHFNKGVKNVQAQDLLVNGTPATNVVPFAPDVYVFEFPAQAPGTTRVEWSTGQQIVDLTSSSNRFAGGQYSYTVDPAAASDPVIISEFMAANTSTIRDGEGKWSDWIELYNSGDSAVGLSGWYLSDDPTRLAKWRFPNGITLRSKTYLLVWATGNDLTNAAAPLHTNFKLDKTAGGFLGLTYSDGTNLVSSFVNYPQQTEDTSYGRDRANPSITGYFVSPTPGAANATVGAGFGSEVRFSVESGTFTQPFQLTLWAADSNSVIRYFLVTNGTTAAMTGVPDASSPVYTGPLSITESMQVRARSFPAQPGYFPGPLRTKAYVHLADNVAGFSSDIPVVVFHNMGGGPIAATEEQFVTMQVFDKLGGRSALTRPPNLAVQGYFHRRGQSTFGNAKANLRVETQDAYGADMEVELLGMPAESDWVFYAVNEFDKVLMHNPMAHTLYRQMGHYSSNTRFVEVYVKDDSGTAGPLTQADYMGLYVVEEKIKIDKNRVDIDTLQPEDTDPEEITGGYLMSVDKGNPTDSAYMADMFVWFLDPDYFDMSSPGRAAQRQYIENYFNSFYEALYGPQWTNSQTGYAQYIDMDSWIDFHLHNTFLFNADMLRISSYFYKPRGGKIVQGPIWDFDRSFGNSSDDRGFNPRRWTSGASDGGTDPFNAGGTFHNPWYRQMFKDPDFWQRWIDRYQELRKNVYSLTNINAVVDGFASEVREATTREYNRWFVTRPRTGNVTGDSFTYSFPIPGTWDGEVGFVKYWFNQRLDFMDSNFLKPPVLNRGSGSVTNGTVVQINTGSVRPNTTIYYTLDGTDPRLPGGAVSPTALSNLNSAPITLTQNARVFARNYNAAHKNLTGGGNPPISSSWSSPTVATFAVSNIALAITEIMYNPAPPASGTNNNDDFEFIELKNVGTETIVLAGIRFTQGIDFTFGNSGPVTQLGPGQYAVVVRNQAAFASRYPAVVVAGVFTNQLNNGGERITLEGALQEPILSFEYDNQWYPATDGQGFSLVLRNEDTTDGSWTNAAAWRASTFVGGSPGQPDPAPVNIPAVLINEALTHTDPPQLDAVELYNPTTGPASIGGWFLTDDPSQPKKFMIPAGTVLDAGAYKIFDESQFAAGGSGFRLSSFGDELYLFSGDGTNLTGYRHGFDFGAAPNGVSFGRHVSSDGREHFVAQRGSTLGAANSGPLIGPVVVNEIMYAPVRYSLEPNTLEEYVEIWNMGNVAVALYDPAYPTNAWQIGGGVSFSFPLGLSLAPGEYMLLVNFDPEQDPAALEWFRTRYSLSNNVAIVGPFSGNLANEGEQVTLYKPDVPETAPSPVVGFVPRIVVEQVDYSPFAPWPPGTLESGKSLQRVRPEVFGDDPGNWAAAIPTPGAVNTSVSSGDADNDGLPDAWETANGFDPADASGVNGATGDPDSDGATNLAEYIGGTDPKNPNDYLAFETAAVTANGPVLSFIARSGRTYTVEARDDLGSTQTWSVVQSNITGNGEVTVTDPNTKQCRYYRLKVALQ